MKVGQATVSSSVVRTCSSPPRHHAGTLAQISMEDSSISLHNVKSYGSEGRRVGAQVPPSPDVYEYIIFKGKMMP